MQPGDRVRTYRARGRSSPGQQALLERLRPTYVLNLDELRLFAPAVLEIGCGTSEATLQLAATDPRPMLAVEVHPPGVAALLQALEARGLDHVRLHEGDGRDVLARLAHDSLDEVRIFFPDPWPKARHAKRRLVGPELVADVADRLRPGGRLHVATDWPAYASAVEQAIAASARMVLVGRERGERPVTRFELRGRAAGRPARDLVAERR